MMPWKKMLTAGVIGVAAFQDIAFLHVTAHLAVSGSIALGL
jgi:hypothetical protein